MLICSSLNSDIIFITRISINIAPDIINNIAPALEAFLPAINETFIIDTNNDFITAITAIPLFISESSRYEISLITPIIIPIAIDISISIFPACDAYFPANVETAIIPANNNSIALITNKPLAIDSASRPETIFITLVIISIAPAIIRSIAPTFVIFAKSATDGNFPKATNKNVKPITIAVSP